MEYFSIIIVVYFSIIIVVYFSIIIYNLTRKAACSCSKNE